MVTSPHALASQAGVAVLQAGGSAVDAAIAAASVLCARSRRPGGSPAGHAHGITIDPESGARVGGADPRSDGAAIGY